MPKSIKCEFKKEKIISCILIDDKGEKSWGVFYPDDGSEKLIFSKNIDDLQYLDDFTGYKEDEIINHLNKYGFEIESVEKFGNILEYKEFPVGFTISLVETTLHHSISAKFKL